MFKKLFSKKKNEIQEEEIITRDEWLKRDYILVPNETTPNDLTNYQKLIVLRKPEGEKRCIVDFALSFDDVDKLHYESQFQDVDIYDKNFKRLIPTYLNTKEIDDDVDNTDEEEIRSVSRTLAETADEFKLSDSELKDSLLSYEEIEVPILRVEEKSGKIFQAKLDLLNKKRENTTPKNNEVDDIDGVDILTEDDYAIRQEWSEVDNYIETEESIERRELYSDVDQTLSPFYVPKIQPLFRNFIDIDFSDMKTEKFEQPKTLYDFGSSDLSTDSNDNVSQEIENIEMTNVQEMVNVENEDPEIIFEQQPEVIENAEVVQENNGDPEIILGDIEESLPEQVSVIEQPKILSFFKNEVVASSRMGYGQNEHIEKHSKFFRGETRNVKYQKFILDKKRKIYNIRKMLA
ncbi:MAG: hypothetical protein K2J69_02580 [Malacoplasma sp.]|nr:hypothetical protein [Malacoplasma sp.]MDE6646175.1 hypothetical protein [Malacoplasma sp.]MDE7075519.1 hypothetical protein [Malacoplasma sp.]MDE7088070.1 hypothetical protein [Malacoplasma sp.]